MTSGEKKANRLIHTTSPYLLQHAYNPVDWFPWGPEALAASTRLDKPILVSIGYSSCHWCHVMEHESFENEEIAGLMNEHFVCIKVDREERPDIDHIYMAAVQAMNQHGGWPLNVFLTPDQIPFFGGTYFPPKNWSQLLIQISNAFRSRRAEIDKSAEDLRTHLQISDLERFARDPALAGFTADALHKMFSGLKSRFDTTWGGMDKAPKFVMPAIWQFLLRYFAMQKDREALEMTLLTLKKMSSGGLYDLLGGGFARYSVDGRWFAPHFEKMLYDNAQLLSLYSEAYRISQDPLYKQIIYDTVGWLRREMTSSEGGFYSALDADSEGHEGKFYTWTWEELREVLGADTERVAKFLQATPEGNWEHGRNILYSTSNEAVDAGMRESLDKLMARRNARIHPGLDDKILTGWNAMTVCGLLDAYKALADPLFLQLALQNLHFLDAMLVVDEKVSRAFKGKASTIEGFLEDYAFLIQAYAAAYQITFDESWLNKSSRMIDYVMRMFYDEEDGYFHFSSRSAERLIAQKKEIFDNVVPASNGVMARNLLHVGTLLENAEWQRIGTAMVARLSSLIESEPGYMSHWAMAFAEITAGFTEVAITGDEADLRRLELHKHFAPFALTLGSRGPSSLALLRDKHVPGKTVMYLCRHKTCGLPVESVSDALAQLS